MKRIIPAILALSLLTACGGESTEPAQTTAAQTVTTASAAQTETTAAAETTAATSKTTAAVTSAAQTTAQSAASTASAAGSETAAGSSAAATTAEQTAAQTAGTTAAKTVTTAAKTTAAAKKTTAPSGEKSLTQQLIDRLNNLGDDTVKIVLKEEMEGMSLEVTMYRSGTRSYADSTAMGIHLISIEDGKNSYTLLPDEKVYAVQELPDLSQQNNNAITFLTETVDASELVGTGKGKFKGKNCTYEEFEAEDGKGGKDTVRYYFDDKGNLLGLELPAERVSGAIADVGTFSIEYTVTFSEKISDSQFALPQGYQEITPTEMTVKIFAAMTASAGGLGSGSTPGLIGAVK